MYSVHLAVYRLPLTCERFVLLWHSCNIFSQICLENIWQTDDIINTYVNFLHTVKSSESFSKNIFCLSVETWETQWICKTLDKSSS